MRILVTRPAPINQLFMDVKNLLVQAYNGLFFE
jgi:hypothetical protein